MKKILLSVLLAVAIALPLGSVAVKAEQAVSLPDTAGVAASIDASTQKSLENLRNLRNSFKDAKDLEIGEKAKEAKAKGKASIDAAKKKVAQVKKDKEDKRKQILVHLIDLEIKHFNNTADRVAKMPNITPEIKAQLKLAIDNALQSLKDQKVKVEAAVSDEAVKTLAKETKDLFKTHREIVKKIVEAIHSSKENKFITKAEERAAAIETKIIEIKAQGKDVTELLTILTAARADIAAAKGKVSSKSFIESNEFIKSAYEKFKTIAEKAKAL